MNPSRPLILITNDDGHGSKGVRALMEFVKDFGDLYVVCPSSQHSGQSMAITVTEPLRMRRMPDENGAHVYTVDGTPADCVKLSVLHILPRRPDLVIAGINHGSNASVNVNYSGTMGAVCEGCAYGIPSIGFSLTDHSMDAEFEPCRPFVRRLVEMVLEKGLPEGICLNVNVPDGCVPVEMRLTRDCKGRWNDEYVEYRDPSGHPFFWLAGKFINLEPENTDTDIWCLDHGIVSVVPTTIDRTAKIAGLPGWPVDLNSTETTGRLL